MLTCPRGEKKNLKKKGAIGQLIKSTAIDYAPYNSVNCICPAPLIPHCFIKLLTCMPASLQQRKKMFTETLIRFSHWEEWANPEKLQMPWHFYYQMKTPS